MDSVKVCLSFVGLKSTDKNTKSAENGVLGHLMAPHSYCKLLWEMQLESLSKRKKRHVTLFMVTIIPHRTLITADS